jgi:sulfate/thiosulfate transport system ATP-binding protein
MTMTIELERLSKRFGDFVAVDDVSLSLSEGQLTALLGPSGSGKTTLLRLIAGLERPDAGHIRVNGQDITKLHVSHRSVGFVFQHYALFQHMNVFDNVAFGLTVKPWRERPNKATIRKRVTELLDLVQLSWTADRYPSQLSGGQRQRIALARALAVEPRVLLLDEPFGALDAKVRAELRRWLRRLHDEIHVTSVFVTHDQEEALEVSDRVVVMNQGRVEQDGTPEDVYDKPANPFVYGFLGNVNLFPARIENGKACIGNLTVATPEHQGKDSQPGWVYVRPHDIELLPAEDQQGSLHAMIELVSVVGPTARVELRADGTSELLHAELPKQRLVELGLMQGAEAWIRPLNSRVFLDSRDSEP